MVAPGTRPDASGRWVGRYRLRWEVASGGMGTVYLAQLDGPHGFGKWVAVKLMHQHLTGDRRVVDMFLDEARLAARIQHNHVCAVIDFGETEGVPFMVMEFLQGEPLSALLRSAKQEGKLLPWWLAARVVADAARGLHAAHELRDERGELIGLVHRDVSPQNVFVQYEGAAKVVDFGVARARGRLSTTRSGELKGKLAYMSPEQIRGGEVDRRTDIWALGVVLWESIAGRRLFRSENEGETLFNVLQEPIPRLRALRKDCPADLDAIAERALSRQASKRFATCAEQADAIDKCLFGRGEPAGHAQVSEWMEQRFGERRRQRDSLLRKPDTDVQVLPGFEAGSESQSSLRSRIPASLAPLLDDDDVEELDTEADTDDETGRLTPSAELPMEPTSATIAARPSLTGSQDEPLPTRPSIPSGIVASASTRLGGPGARAGARTVIAVFVIALIGIATAAVVVPRLLSPTVPTTPIVVTVAVPIAPTHAPPPTVPTQPPTAPSVPVPVAPTADVDHPGSRSSSGQLFLLAIPAAEVRWRGRGMGRTPIAVRLPVGRQRLTLRAVRGDATRTVTVDIRSGRTTRLTVRFD